MLHNGKNKQLAGCLTIKVVERGWEREKGGIKMFGTEIAFTQPEKHSFYPISRRGCRSHVREFDETRKSSQMKGKFFGKLLPLSEKKPEIATM